MHPICYKKGPLRVAETWFQDAPSRPEVDLVRCMQIPAPVAGAACDEFHTLVVDLSGGCDEMLAQMDRGTRYEIRRAQTQDELRYEHRLARRPEDIEDFFTAYTTNLAAGNDALSINRAKLLRFAAGGHLDLSIVADNRGAALTWHVHILSAGTARLLYSVSEASSTVEKARRNLAGRANRQHHWLDMQRFKAAGCGRYDFGGFYMGATDSKKLRINEFKKSFGGQLVLTYNCIYPLSLKGRMAFAAWRLLRLGRR